MEISPSLSLCIVVSYFVAGVKLFDEPPERRPPTEYTPSKSVSVASDTDVTPYINVCDVFVNSGDESSMVALLTVLGHFSRICHPDHSLM